MIFRKSKILFCLSLPWMAFASPEGMQVIAGNVTAPVRDSKGALIIEAGKQAIVHWDSFSIQEHETVRFLQPDSHSAILNRVVGFTESKIDGQLFANGQLFLINKNGVVIGPNGRIETAAFIASTSDFLNEDFLKGQELLFKGSSDKSVIHLGKIEALDGDILLIGSRVLNQGDLTANRGTVGVACGNEVLIQPEGKERIFIKMALDTPKEEEFVLDQAGTIQALNVELKTGTRPYAKAIRFSGKAEALSVQEEAGHVYLVAEEGMNAFSGEIKSKDVRILGKEVCLEKGKIFASGETKGGTVLIGGDYQGKNPEILNSLHTFVGPEVSIQADAIESGDGGKVVVWSDQATAFYGHISARGGAQSGDGGFVEVSGSHLSFDGLVDRRAPNGKAGNLLLDPINITIGAGMESPNVSYMFGMYSFTDCSSPANINSTSLATNLGMGGVTIDTSGTGGAGCMDQGTIDIFSSISWVGDTILGLNANSNVSFQPGITITGGGVTVMSQTNISVFGTTFNLSNSLMLNTTSNTSNVTLSGCNIHAGSLIQVLLTGFVPGGQSFNTDSSSFSTMGGVQVDCGGNIEIASSTIPPMGGSFPGAVGLSSSAGSILIGGGSTWEQIGSVNLTAATDISIIGSTIQTGTLSVTLSSGDFNITNSSVSASTAILSIPNDLIISSHTSVLNLSQLALPVGSSLTIPRNLVISSTAGRALLGGEIGINGDIELTVGGDVTVQTSGSGSFAGIGVREGSLARGNISLDVTGAVNLESGVSGSIARIGHDATMSIMGDITVTTLDAVNVTASNGGYALIGSDRATTYFAPNNISVLAATNINMTTSSPGDYVGIGNIGLTNGSNANVTLVSDNAFPDSLGPGGVNLSGPGTTQLFAYSGNRLSIYSVNSLQNTFPSSINNAAYPPSVTNINSNYQEFSIFYPNGTYIGPEYMIFYKAPASPTATTAAAVADSISTTVLQTLLDPASANSTLSEHGTAETEEKKLDQSHHTPYNNDKRGGVLCH